MSDVEQELARVMAAAGASEQEIKDLMALTSLGVADPYCSLDHWMIDLLIDRESGNIFTGDEQAALDIFKQDLIVDRSRLFWQRHNIGAYLVRIRNK